MLLSDGEPIAHRLPRAASVIAPRSWAVCPYRIGAEGGDRETAYDFYFRRRRRARGLLGRLLGCADWSRPVEAAPADGGAGRG